MGALFDLSFTKFISPTIARIVYVVGAIVIGLTYITFVVLAFNEGAGAGLVMLLIVGPIVALFYLCILRVVLESLMATILTAQNTGELVKLGGGSAPGGPSFPTGYTPPPTGPPAGSYPPPSGQNPPAGPPTGSTPPPAPGAPPAP